MEEFLNGFEPMTALTPSLERSFSALPAGWLDQVSHAVEEPVEIRGIVNLRFDRVRISTRAQSLALMPDQLMAAFHDQPMDLVEEFGG